MDARGVRRLAKIPRALAGRLRRAQTSLRTFGIEIAFSREGRQGTRIIRMSASHGNPTSKTVRTVSTVSNDRPSKSGNPAPRGAVDQGLPHHPKSEEFCPNFNMQI